MHVRVTINVSIEALSIEEIVKRRSDKIKPIGAVSIGSCFVSEYESTERRSAKPIKTYLNQALLQSKQRQFRHTCLRAQEARNILT